MKSGQTRRVCGAGVLVVFCLVFPLQSGNAAQMDTALPLWEARIFTGVASLPHYRGSDESTLYVLPLPYVIYRGELIRANREGFRGVLAETDRLEMEISMGGNPPVDRDNEARQDMPDIGAILEAGPMLKVHLRDRHHPDHLYAAIAARAAISIDQDDFDVNYQGVRGDMRIAYRNKTWLADRNINFGITASIDYANRDYHGYFYEVETRYATEIRPAHSPQGGYAGFGLSAYVNKKLNDRFSLGAYVRWDNLAGAVFADSPLVRTENNLILGCALSWKLTKSKKFSPYEVY